MSFTTFFKALALVALAKPICGSYSLKDDYSTDDFFSKFEFFTAVDPTAGFVQYVDQGTALSTGLISNNNGSIFMGVDHDNITPNGRSSVRLTSNEIYNHGLIILDVAHMPEGCGTWPAFWTTGPNWPSNGEIDIIEGVNDQSHNAMTLHTGPSCSITDNGSFLGSIQTSSCDVNDPNQPDNAGCSIEAPDGSNTYGTGLNSINGGVYAMDWTSQGISTYFFPRSSIPSDIQSGKPDPSGWGKPLATFQGGCDIDSNFRNQQIVFDTTFCGDWAGNAWSSSSTCASKASTCNDFVANNPSAFADAYWEVNSLKVYQDGGVGDTASSTDAGPTGIVSTLPAAVSTLAPIPETSVAPTYPTTFAISAKSTAASVVPLTNIGAWSSPAPSSTYGEAFAAATTAAAAATTTPTAIFSAGTSEAAVPTSAPAWTPTTVAAGATTTASTDEWNNNGWNGQWSQDEAQPAQADWFGNDSPGIPEDWSSDEPHTVPSSKKERRHARHLLRHKRHGKVVW